MLLLESKDRRRLILHLSLVLQGCLRHEFLQLFGHVWIIWLCLLGSFLLQLSWSSCAATQAVLSPLLQRTLLPKGTLSNSNAQQKCLQCIHPKCQNVLQPKWIWKSHPVHHIEKVFPACFSWQCFGWCFWLKLHPLNQIFLWQSFLFCNISLHFSELASTFHAAHKQTFVIIHFCCCVILLAKTLVKVLRQVENCFKWKFFILKWSLESFMGFLDCFMRQALGISWWKCFAGRVWSIWCHPLGTSWMLEWPPQKCKWCCERHQQIHGDLLFPCALLGPVKNHTVKGTTEKKNCERFVMERTRRNAKRTNNPMDLFVSLSTIVWHFPRKEHGPIRKCRQRFLVERSLMIESVWIGQNFGQASQFFVGFDIILTTAKIIIMRSGGWWHWWSSLYYALLFDTCNDFLECWREQKDDANDTKFTVNSTGISFASSSWCTYLRTRTIDLCVPGK